MSELACSQRNVCFSSDEPQSKLPQKVSASLLQALEKLEISKKAELEQKGQCVCVFKPDYCDSFFALVLY